MLTFHVFITEAEATKKPVAKKKPVGNTKADKLAADKHVAITFGRFNPPHAGHGKLMDAVKAHGGDSGNYRIYPSRTQDHKKNPLSADQKVDHMRKMFKGHKDAIQNSEQHRNIFDIMRDLNDEGHEHVTMVVGDDRVKEFQKLTDKYNGVHYDFKSINIKSAGKRNKDSDDPMEKLSASGQRKHASGDDHDNFHAGMPQGFSKAHSMKLMADVKAGMTPPEKAAAKKKKAKAKKESWLFAPKLYQQELREHYIEEDLFAVGTLVEYDDTGIRGHIVHRGSNYVILKDSNGDEFRTWLHHVTEVADASKNRADQSNFSADDGSGNDWKVGTDKYRQAVQAMTPGQATTKFGVKFSDFRKTATPK
tara:strand:+ start:163 stop:1254 length:1092 start_codon:yes stop_codon:yes gene_type:complete